jgi:formylmethanofuran dehydrogenase subunit C
MPLKLHLKNQLNVPLSVDGVLPEESGAQDFHSIRVMEGNRAGLLSDYFEMEGSAVKDRILCFSGNLKNVYGIGQAMKGGTIEVQGDTGPFVGRGMSGGRIVVVGNADDYLGAEMTGGQIVVRGDAGNYVGANPPGSKYGMNRGTIFISGSAGESLGRRMRRGTIVAQGAVGALCGWEMLAGTILVFGSAGEHVGLDMKRGTIIRAGELATSINLSNTFVEGTAARSQTIAMIAQWLKQSDIEMPLETIDQCLLKPKFLQWHGDLNEGGRGEIFAPVEG